MKSVLVKKMAKLGACNLDNIEMVRLFNPLNELDIVYPMNVRAKEKLEKKD